MQQPSGSCYLYVSQMADDSIEVKVNGTNQTIVPHSTLLDLLRVLEIDPGSVVVEHNMEIVRRPNLEKTALSAGDSVEIVHFVGGG